MIIPITFTVLTLLQTITSMVIERDTSSCPLTLTSNNYEFPHLIIPFTNTTSYHNSYFPEISPTTSTAFNFDIPSSRQSQHCTLHLSLPRNDQLVTSHIDFSPPNNSNAGSVIVSKYKTPATDGTFGGNQPECEDGKKIDVQLGRDFVVWEGECVPGVMSWRVGSDDTNLRWFQDWNECAIGLWVVYGEKNGGCGRCPDLRMSHAAWMEGLGMAGTE